MIETIYVFFFEAMDKLLVLWYQTQIEFSRAHLPTTGKSGSAVRAVNDRPYILKGKLSLTNTEPVRWTVAESRLDGIRSFLIIESLILCY